MNKKRDAASLRRVITKENLDDEVDAILALSDEELDAFIDENGGDSRAIRAGGEALAKQLFAKRERLGWHATMEQKIDAFREKAAAPRTRGKLPRAELLSRIDIARKNPRFAAPVATMFSKKTAEASTDEELEALLDAIELLAKIEED